MTTLRETLIQKAYRLGFEASAEGWNGEYPFEGQDVLSDKHWLERREQNLAVLSAPPSPSVPDGVCRSNFAENDHQTGLTLTDEPQKLSVPDGYVVVPREPTYAMVHAAGEYVLSVGGIDCMHAEDRPEFGIKGRETGSAEIYRAMITAADKETGRG